MPAVYKDKDFFLFYLRAGAFGEDKDDDDDEDKDDGEDDDEGEDEDEDEGEDDAASMALGAAAAVVVGSSRSMIAGELGPTTMVMIRSQSRMKVKETQVKYAPSSTFLLFD